MVFELEVVIIFANSNSDFKNVGNRRKLFEQYATSKGLDPYNSQDWYNVNMSIPGLMSVKVSPLPPSSFISLPSPP